MYSRKATDRGRWRSAVSLRKTWRNSVPVSSTFRCPPSAASDRGLTAAVSIRWCKTVSGITDRQGQLFPGAEPGPQFYPVSAIDYLTGYLMAYGALTALARRAREGGSWLVRISLAQIGKWLVDRGQVPESSLCDVASDFSADEISQWCTVSDVPAGRLTHLSPTVQLSETQPYWARPTVPLGYHDPVWPGAGGMILRRP